MGEPVGRRAPGVRPAGEPPERTRSVLTNLRSILVLALIVREAFSFWTGHPYDFEAWIRSGHAVATGQNPYAFLPAVPGASFAYPNTTLPGAAYLPFWSVLMGGLFQLWHSIGLGDRFILYLLLKQPGILADVATAFLLYRSVRHWTGSEAKALDAAAFWALFPYPIVITAIWGQFDSIVVDLILLMVIAGRIPEREFHIGLAILVKWITAIFLPFEFFRERRWNRLGVLVGLAVPLVLTGLVFLAEGWSISGVTAGSISQSHGGGFGMNYAYFLSVPPGSLLITARPLLGTVLTWLWIPAVAAAGWLGARWLPDAGPAAELRAVMFIVTVFLFLRWGLYEQYFLYLFALLVADVHAFHPSRFKFLNFLWGLAFVDLLVNNDLGIRFAAPIVPGIVSFTQAIDAAGPYATFRSYALFVLAALVTASLVQVLLVLLRDEPRPRPWFISRRPFLTEGAPAGTTQ